MSLFYAFLFFALVVAAFIAWDKSRGTYSRKNERILFEDALKHLYDCEYNAIDCTPDSVSGYLSIKREHALTVIAGLENLKLITTDNGRLHLTDEGRSYALRMVRIHRLWEQYLADRTGIMETEWHSIAEEKEHQLTDEEADQLAARLGNPLKDPHGDPIPTASGKMHSHMDIPLSDLKEGQYAIVRHVEDEPKEIYSQIRALDLYPGAQVQMLKRADNSLQFITRGKKHELFPAFAHTVNVSVINEQDKIKKSFRNLSSIRDGELAEVAGISKALRGQHRRRLLDLGIVPGTKVKAVITSLGGDPTAYEVRGALIALRKNQSDYIYIKEKESL